MDEEKAYELLQEFLSLAGQLAESGYYSAGEIIAEVKTRLGDE